MADVLGEAIVEIIPDLKDFGKKLNKQMSGVIKEVSNAVDDIDREFESLNGSLDDTFKGLSAQVDKEFAAVSASIDKHGQEAATSQDRAAKNSESSWRISGSGIDGIFADMSLGATKSAKEIEKEFDRAAKATEKALANSAKLAAKEIESDMKRAAKATEKALKDSAKLAEKEYNEMAKAAKKAADEEEKLHLAAKKAAEDSDGGLARLASRLGSLGGLFAKVGSAAGTIGSILPVAAALVSTLQAAAGAALILPGALVAIGLAGATLKIAFTGIGEALSADNAKELDAAMANLPKTAQEFVKSLRNVKDEFEGVRRGVQSVFFSGLDKQIDELGAVYLPVVTRGLLGIATELNHSAAGFMNMLKEASNVKSIDSIFDSARISTKNLGEALAPLGQAFLDIADVGASVFADLTDGAGTAAQKFADFIRELKESGRLEEIMRGGIEALKVLGGLLADIGAIAKNVFGPLIEGAGQLGTPLNAVLDTFREFTAQQEFINMMRDLGKIMGDLAGAIGQVLGAALDAVLPTLQKFIGLISDHLQKVLPVIVPMLQRLVDFFGDLLFAITPIIEPFFTLIQQLLPPMAELLERIIAVIDVDKVSALATTIGESLSQSITTLMPNIIELADKLGTLFEKMGPTIDTFLDFAINTLPIVIAGLTWLTQIITDFISIAIDPLIAAWQLVSFIVVETWEAAKQWIVQKVAEIIIGIETMKEIPGKVGEWFGQMRQRAIEKIAELVNDVRAIPGKMLDALGNLGSLLWDAGARVIDGFISGIQSKISQIKTVLGSITSLIPSVKGPPEVDKKLLTPNGQLIMQGLIAGFKMGEKDVKTTLNAITGNIVKQMDMTGAAQSAASSVNQMTTKFGAGGAITQAAMAQQLAMNDAVARLEGGDQNVDVTVVMGDEVLDSMVTDVIVKRDKRTKRAVTAGGRRTP